MPRLGRVVVTLAAFDHFGHLLHDPSSQPPQSLNTYQLLDRPGSGLPKSFASALRQLFQGAYNLART